MHVNRFDDHLPFWMTASAVRSLSADAVFFRFLVAYLQSGRKNWHIFLRVPYNFVRYRPVFKLFSLSELGERL